MESWTSPRTRLVAQVLLTLAAIVILIPIGAAIVESLQGDGIYNYLDVLRQPSLPRFFLNSVIISGGTIALVTSITMVTAYAFAKLDFPGKRLLYILFILGLLVPGLALIVPAFLVIKNAGLLNSYPAVIAPLVAWSLPFTLLITRSFILGISDEIIDAARIDGASSMQVLLQVIVPLSKPIIAVVAIWSFLTSWNEFFLGLVFMRDESMQLITQLPSVYQLVYMTDTSRLFAALVIISLPVILAYIRLRRMFEDGLTAGSLR